MPVATNKQTERPSCLEPRQKENRLRTEKLTGRRLGKKDACSFKNALAVQVDLAFRRVERKELVGAGGKNRRTKNMLLRELEEQRIKRPAWNGNGQRIVNRLQSLLDV